MGTARALSLASDTYSRRIDPQRYVDKLTEPPHVAGRVSGAGPVYLLKDTGQESFLAARYRLANFEMQIAEREFVAGGEKFPAGSWILARQAGLPEAIQSTAAELGLDFTQDCGCTGRAESQGASTAHRRMGSMG